MKILIIGGTRFIGPALVRRLAEQHEVTVFHRGITETPLPGVVHHHHGDRGVPAMLGSALTAAEPEVVVDMVAHTARDVAQTVEILAGRAKRVVVIGSLDVYRAYELFAGLAWGPAEPTPIDEDAPLRASRHPRRGRARGTGDWRHDYDKLVVEQTYRAEPRLAVTCLRLPFVYGEADYRHRVRQLLRRMQNQKMIRLSSSEAAWRATRGYVVNIAAAVALAVTDSRAANRVYNLGDAGPLTTAEWARAVGRVADWRGEVVVGESSGEEPIGPWGHHLVLSTERIRRELGHVDTVGLDEGLERTVRWERGAN